jgi:hypothetical protein
MVGVLGQHRPQLPASHDQHAVQHLTPNGANPPLRVGVRPRCPHRRAQHLDSLGGKDRIERGGELRVPIADQKRWARRARLGRSPSLTLDLDGLQVGMVHDAGPRAGRLRRLRLRFPTAGLVVFGHWHIPLDLKDEQLSLRIFNPGSPTDRRRQRQGTMGLLRVGRGRLTAARIVPVTSPRDGAERSGVAHLRAPLRPFTDRISIGETLS